MPVIEFTSAIAAPLELQILMLHPLDPMMRARAFVMQTVDAMTVGAPTSPIMLERQQVRLLLDAPSLADIRAEQISLTKMGFLAGRVLACLYLCQRFRHSHRYFVPSMNRAVFVSTVQGAEGGTFGDGSPLPRSDRTVRDAWRAYGSVAHLWAAASMESLGYPFAPTRELFSPEWIGRFLGVAAALHRFGTSFVPDGASPQVPVMNASDSWAVPPNVVPTELTSTREPDLLRRILQRYRIPPKRKNVV